MRGGQCLIAVTAGLVGLLLAGGSSAQGQALGPPVPADPPIEWRDAPEAFPRLQYVPEPPPPAPVAPPGPAVPDLPFPDPGPDGWGPYGPGSCPPQWFFSVDLAYLFPAVKNQVGATVTFAHGPTRFFALPDADLGESLSPRFEVGYRLPDSLGFFAGSYRFIHADGSEAITNATGDYQLRSRLDINSFDFDYGLPSSRFAPRWVLDTRIGLRFADVFFDSQLTNARLTQQIGNNYFGAGPHVRFEVQRQSLLPGVTLFGNLDGALLVGQVRQRFREQVFAGGATVADTNFLFRQTQTAPVLGLQAGVMYTPPARPRLHFRGGYQFERWFEVARANESVLGATANSAGEVTAQGLFLNCQIDY